MISFQSHRSLKSLRKVLIKNDLHHIAIVGSGPSAFYTAKYLLDNNRKKDIKIDIYEKLPTPFGLVRSGVAPDHQDVKVVTNTFAELFQKHQNSLRYFGNIHVLGENENLDSISSMNLLQLDHLRSVYSGVILACGASSDVTLKVPGNNGIGILSARSFVNWYNGHPDFVNIGNKIDLSKVENVVIIGQGNVAIDCARILGKSYSELLETDIATHALDQLSKSNIKKISILGRRGHVQSSFTIKEIRELSKLNNSNFSILKSEIDEGLTDASKTEIENNRPKTRIVELLNTIASKPNNNSNDKRNIELRYLVNPKEFILDDSDHVKKIIVERTKLEGPSGKQIAIGTGITEEMPCQLVLVSVGYKSTPILNAPFDYDKNIVPNLAGRVYNPKTNNENETGLYVVGWMKRGPTGIIGTNITDAKETTASILDDIEMNKLDEINENDDPSARIMLPTESTISWKDYENIDKAEIKRGQKHNPIKIRDKILDINELVNIAKI